MSKKNEKKQIALDALNQMNLTKYDKDPEKADFVNDRDLARQLGVSKTTVWKARQELIRLKDPGRNIVYAWRWSGDNTCAKIGKSTIGGLKDRMPATYHPTDDPVLIGVMMRASYEESEDLEQYFLRTLEQTRPDREWVIIDAQFNEIIDEAFISDPHGLGEWSVVSFHSLTRSDSYRTLMG